MSNFVLFDTSILVDQLRTGRHQAKIQSITELVRTSSVVLAELWRGASEAAEREVLRVLEKNYPVLVPTRQNWIESGELLNKLRRLHGFLCDLCRLKFGENLSVDDSALPHSPQPHYRPQINHRR